MYHPNSRLTISHWHNFFPTLLPPVWYQTHSAVETDSWFFRGKWWEQKSGENDSLAMKWKKCADSLRTFWITRSSFFSKAPLTVIAQFRADSKKKKKNYLNIQKFWHFREVMSSYLIHLFRFPPHSLRFPFWPES